MTNGLHRGKAGNRIRLEQLPSTGRSKRASSIVVTVEIEKNDPRRTWPNWRQGYKCMTF